MPLASTRGTWNFPAATQTFSKLDTKMAKKRIDLGFINVLAAAFGSAFLGKEPGQRTSGAYTRYLKKTGKLAMTDADREALQAAQAKRERKNEIRLYNARRCAS
jgi:hypothetical protein